MEHRLLGRRLVSHDIGRVGFRAAAGDSQARLPMRNAPRRPGARVVELRSHEGNWRSLEAPSLVLGQTFGAVVQPVPKLGEEPWFDADAIVKALA